jgi:hypothetical protein
MQRMGSPREREPRQEIDLSAKRVRIRGDLTRNHVALVVSFCLIAVLPLVTDRFSGSGGFAFGVVLAVLLVIVMVVLPIVRVSRKGDG